MKPVTVNSRVELAAAFTAKIFVSVRVRVEVSYVQERVLDRTFVPVQVGELIIWV